MTAARGKKSGGNTGRKPAKKSSRTGGKSAPAKSQGARPKSKPRLKSKAKKPLVKPGITTRSVAAPKPPKPQPHSAIVEIALNAIADLKGVNVTTLDVRGVTDIADNMIIVSGNSDRHVRAIAARVIEFAKKAGFRPMGVEGERDGEWVLVDLQDVIVHVMLPRVREFYRLESLWDVTAARREAAGQ
jgi:ribosome-associated protein